MTDAPEEGVYIKDGRLVVDMAAADKMWESMDMEQQHNAMCLMFDPILKTAKELREEKECLEAENKRLREALDWAYSGPGLDYSAILAQQVLNPFSNPESPDHAVQVALRLVIDAIRERAALEDKG